MGNTVYAMTMGLFHKKSGGKGMGPVDTALTPPPPPAGPLPVPYINIMIANDLKKGTTTVKIQSSPTAIEDASKVKPTSGDEAATQGGGIMSFKTKGEAQFKLWCFSVKAEGKGVSCNGHLATQNMNGIIANCIDPAAVVDVAMALATNDSLKKCPPYNRDDHSPNITAAQDREVHGKTCWECQGQIDAGQTPLTIGGKYLGTEKEYQTRGGGKLKDRDRAAMTPDHQPPLKVVWEMGGCHIPEPHPADPSGFKELMSQPEMVKPHCRNHSNAQGPTATAFGNSIRNNM